MSTLATANVESLADETPPVFKDLSGSREVIQGAWAWVNFNGTGAVAIRDSFNVTSLTDDGTGTYQVNLTNAIPNANAAAVAGAQAGTTSASGNRAAMPAMIDASTIRITCYTLASPAFTDGEYLQCAVFCNP